MCGTETAESTAIGKSREDKEVSLCCVVQVHDVCEGGLWGVEGN